MVTSGNSSRSSLSTSPMEWWGVRTISDPPSAVTVHERDPVPPALHLVAVMQLALVDALAVDVGAVQRALVLGDEASAAVVAPDAQVATRHGDVVEEHLGV